MSSKNYEWANSKMQEYGYSLDDVAPENSIMYSRAKKTADEIFKYPDIARKVLDGKLSITNARKEIRKRKQEASIMHALQRLAFDKM